MRKQPCCVSFYLSATVDKPRSLCAFCVGEAMVTRALVNAYSLKVGTRKHIIADSAYDRGD